MKIALDVQSLFEEKKTGIGWTVKMMTENLLKDSRNNFYLNYFSFRNHAEKQKRLACYQQDNTTIACCKWNLPQNLEMAAAAVFYVFSGDAGYHAVLQLCDSAGGEGHQIRIYLRYGI